MGQSPIRKHPWDKIKIPVEYISKDGKVREFDTIIDPGSNVSYMTISYIRELGFDVNLANLTRTTQLVGMYGITDTMYLGKRPRPDPNKRIHASWAFQFRNIIIGGIIIPSPIIRIPLSFKFSSNRTMEDKQFEEREGKSYILIGTDILRNYNYGVDEDKKLRPIFVLTKPKRVIQPRDKKAIRCLEFED